MLLQLRRYKEEEWWNMWVHEQGNMHERGRETQPKHDVGLDKGDGVEHGCGAERNGRAAGGGDRLRKWHTKGRWCGDGSEHSSVDVR